MPVELYYYPLSPPCRAVLLTVEAIGLEVDLKLLDIMAGEHLTPEFEELNPQKTVPFLADDDLKLSESRAIIAYLASQYGENDSLYPQNPEPRALVDQRLYFDLGTLSSNIINYYMPVFKKQVDTYDPVLYENMLDAFKILNTFLEGQDYVAGCNLTIADLAIVSSVTTAQAFGFDITPYENVANWLERIKTSAPGYEKANGEAAETMKNIIENSKIEKGENE